MAGLDPEKLLDLVRRFADRRHEAFGGFPGTRDTARRRWAAAFHGYVSEMVVTQPATVAPDDTSATYAEVEAAFYGRLQLRPVMDAAASADDFAGAWHAAVEAIALVAGAEYAGPGTGTNITAIDPFSEPDLVSRRAILHQSLLLHFRTRAPTTVAQLTRIADDLHTATTGLATICTYNSPSGSVTGPLRFG